MWKLARYCNEESHKIPGWSGYNTLTSMKDSPVSMVRYMPFINGSPSDLSTIYTALVEIVKTCDSMGHDHVLVTADMAIYSNSQQLHIVKHNMLDDVGLPVDSYQPNIMAHT